MHLIHAASDRCARRLLIAQWGNANSADRVERARSSECDGRPRRLRSPIQEVISPAGHHPESGADTLVRERSPDRSYLFPCEVFFSTPQSPLHGTTGITCAYLRGRTARRPRPPAIYGPHPIATSGCPRVNSISSGMPSSPQSPASAYPVAGLPCRHRIARKRPCRAQKPFPADTPHLSATSTHARTHRNRMFFAAPAPRNCTIGTRACRWPPSRSLTARSTRLSEFVPDASPGPRLAKGEHRTHHLVCAVHTGDRLKTRLARISEPQIY